MKPFFFKTLAFGGVFSGKKFGTFRRPIQKSAFLAQNRLPKSQKMTLSIRETLGFLADKALLGKRLSAKTKNDGKTFN